MNNKDEDFTLSITILNREFQVKCEESKAEQLLNAAHYLNECAQRIKNSGKVVDYERIIVMAALNITHESLAQQGEQDGYAEKFKNKMQNLLDKIDSALSNDLELKTER